MFSFEDHWVPTALRPLAPAAPRLRFPGHGLCTLVMETSWAPPHPCTHVPSSYWHPPHTHTQIAVNKNKWAGSHFQGH